jgi:hypothetical protein
VIEPQAAEAQAAFISWTALATKPDPGCTKSTPLIGPRALGVPVAAYSFAGRLPAGWRAVSGAKTTASAGSVAVKTNLETNGYQLIGPILSLPAGRYSVSVDGTLTSGRLGIGLLDDEANKWLGTAPFVDTCTRVNSGLRMALTNVTTAGQRLRVVLFNADASPAPSTWIVRSVIVHQAS